MKYTPKVPNVSEAKAMLGQGKFPYYHPCVKCGKACSTPTKAFWQKRLNEFGNVEELYAKFECRDCRKSKKQIRQEKVAALVAGTSLTPVKHRKPGDPVRIHPDFVGFSVWEDGKFVGTTVERIFNVGKRQEKSYNKGMKKPYEVISFGENFTDEEKVQIMKELNYFYDELSGKFYTDECEDEHQNENNVNFYEL